MPHAQRSLGLGSVLLGIFLACPARAGAQDPAAEPPGAAFVRAERLRSQGKFSEAEPFYRRALQDKSLDRKRRIYDRLIELYLRLDRQDLVIGLHVPFRNLLDFSEDADRARLLDLEVGYCRFDLGDHAGARPLFERALDDRRRGRLEPSQRLTGLLFLARTLDKLGDAGAPAAWKRVETETLARLADTKPAPTPRQRIAWFRYLAEYREGRGEHEQAVELLRGLLPIHEALADVPGRRDTLRLLAERLADLKRWDQAEDAVREALKLHESLPDGERGLRADLHLRLADFLRERKRFAAGRAERDRAAKIYQDVLEKPRTGEKLHTQLEAFWKLQDLRRAAGQFRLALELTRTQGETWAGGHLLQPRLQASEGSLELLAGGTLKARDLLEKAHAALERQQPLNLPQFTRVQVNLAAADLAGDHLALARKRAESCIKLFDDHKLPEDAVLAEAHDLLGTCAAREGDYAQAMNHYRAGLRICKTVGPAADGVRCNLLLNEALLRKSQGEVEAALDTCSRAQEIYETFADPESLGIAAFLAARAGMLATLGRIDQAYALTPRLLALCRQHKIDAGPLVVAGRHCSALHHLAGRDFLQAESIWGDLLALQTKERPSLLLPRTLNYLALTQELQGRLDLAEPFLARARDLQKDNPRSFPVTHFITLWRLADLRRRAGRLEEARRLLEEATAMVEQVRLMTFGDLQQRAAFFAQFAPAFDDLVDVCLEGGDAAGALTALNRGRSRSLLDRLQAAGVDPRRSLVGPEAKGLLAREETSRHRLAALHARARTLGADALSEDQSRKLLAELDQARRDFAAAWSDILAASPLFRTLRPGGAAAPILERLRAEVLDRRAALLVYQFGKETSHVFLASPGVKKVEVFPLEVPASLAKQVAVPEPWTLSEALSSGRGIVIRKLPAKAKAPPAAAVEEPRAPLDVGTARALVDHARLHLADPSLTATRGLILKAKDPSRPLPTQRQDLLADVFLPREVRRRLRDLAPACLVVVPDGPLHKLPLEALQTGAAPKTTFLLDELPPVAYAPSLEMLDAIARRPAIRAEKGPRLLSLGDPAYPEALSAKTTAATELLLLQSRLPRLPFSATEARAVAALFPTDSTRLLLGPAATEKNLRAHLAEATIFHLAAHGFADDRFGNLFGALALTPPTRTDPEEDGYLTLQEVQELPLKNCDLAVLSACMTHVGPQQPLEAGLTLATGFLIGGAHRVVASHWSVDDRSTAALIEKFFAELKTDQDRKDPFAYARALQAARRHVRSQPRWQAPFYWAPFVLIGPPR